MMRLKVIDNYEAEDSIGRIDYDFFDGTIFNSDYCDPRTPENNAVFKQMRMIMNDETNSESKLRSNSEQGDGVLDECVQPIEDSMVPTEPESNEIHLDFIEVEYV